MSTDVYVWKNRGTLLWKFEHVVTKLLVESFERGSIQGRFTLCHDILCYQLPLSCICNGDVLTVSMAADSSGDADSVHCESITAEQ